MCFEISCSNVGFLEMTFINFSHVYEDYVKGRSNSEFGKFIQLRTLHLQQLIQHRMIYTENVLSCYALIFIYLYSLFSFKLDLTVPWQPVVIISRHVKTSCHVFLYSFLFSHDHCFQRCFLRTTSL